MYLKTHANAQAGAQRDREYDWKDIDPKTQVFGFGERPEPN